MKNGDDEEDDEDMKETEKRDEEREERRKKKETEGETERERETPNTDASARSTLKITIGCLCRGPSRRLQGVCSTVRLFGPCFKTGRTRPKKKNACTRVGHRKRCSKWPPLARTHAKHLRMNRLVHACSAASGSTVSTLPSLAAASADGTRLKHHA